MKKYELVKMSGFDSGQVPMILKQYYERQLLDLCERWGLAKLGKELSAQAMSQVVSCLDTIEAGSEMEWVCVHTLRSLVLEGIATHKFRVRNGNSIQRNASESRGNEASILNGYEPAAVDWNQEVQSAFNVAMSALSRHEFDYIMKRYYYFEAVYDSRIEKKFAMLLHGKKQAAFVSNLRQLPALPPGANEIITYLSHIDSFWGNQIGQKGLLMKHPDSEQWLFVQHNYNQKHAAAVPVMILTLLILLVLLLNYLGVITLW